MAIIKNWKSLSWKDKRIEAMRRKSKSKGWLRWDDSHPYFEHWMALLDTKSSTLKKFKEEQNVKKNV